MNKKFNFDDLTKKIEKAAVKAVKAYARDISMRMYWCYEEAVDKFYNDYSPKVYKRKYSLYNFATNSPINRSRYEDRIITPIKNGWSIKMEIGAEFYNGNPYKKTYNVKNTADKEWVFKRAYYGFIHGFTPTENKEWKNDPDIIKRDMMGEDVSKVQGIRLNRYKKPSHWFKKETVPPYNGYKHKSYEERTLGDMSTFAGTTRYSLDAEVRTNIYELKKKRVYRDVGFQEIFDMELEKLKI